ncbi:MAG: AAA family ATPase [Bacteroidales bacterium]|nr:AAA family ATPase [Bacteroidales bacterium]
MLHDVAAFLTDDDGDILVVNGYAGTGKTTAASAVIDTMSSLEVPCVLLSPTGRSAKVLSGYAHRQAWTIHKHIYRQKSHSDSGFGEFSLSPNKARGSLFFVDEVSLIGIGTPSENRSGAVFGTGNLLKDLVDFVRAGTDCKLILLGDAAQLPPVGLESSPALSPEYMSAFGGVRFTQLTTVVRQGLESGILKVATYLRKLITEEAVLNSGELDIDTRGLDDILRIEGGNLIDTLSSAYSRYGTDETIVLTRSNRRAIRYNAGIRAQVQFTEEQLVRGDRLMIVKNCYQFAEELEGTDFIANGDMAVLSRIRNHEERYGLHFADATLTFPDYGNAEIEAKVLLDTLLSESAALTFEESDMLYKGVNEDYSHISSKKKRYDAVREDPYFNALQLKYANAITGHKSQGGQWECVFVDNPLWQDVISTEDLKWLYTAITRAVGQVFLVNFKEFTKIPLSS